MNEKIERRCIFICNNCKENFDMNMNEIHRYYDGISYEEFNFCSFECVTAFLMKLIIETLTGEKFD